MERRGNGISRCRLFLEQQRDSCKYLHDQTVRLINRGCYGTISHDVRAIYQKYPCWYDMNPSNLNPLSRKEAAKRYIHLIGKQNAHNRIECTLDNARQGNAKQEDLRWAAELGRHLVLSGCGNEAEQNRYRRLLAEVYQHLGFARLVLDPKPFDEIKDEIREQIEIDCEEKYVSDFFNLLEKNDVNFNIVTPK